MKTKKKIALVGNPNCGKSSIFNKLTGLKQRTGNYPGITVSKKEGPLRDHRDIDVIDIPGLYDLYPNSMDEAIVVEELLKSRKDLSGVIYVADATSLEKSLLLFSQVADLGLPVIFVLNMIDVADRHNIKINYDLLQSMIGTQVILTNAKTDKDSVNKLYDAIIAESFEYPHAYLRSHYDKLADISDHGSGYANWIQEVYSEYRKNVQSDESHGDFYSSSMVIDLKNRRRFLSNVSNQVLIDRGTLVVDERTSKIDRLVLHPILGTLIFIGLLFILFQAIYSWSEWPMEMMDGIFAFLSEGAQSIFGSGTFGKLMSEGIIPGLGGILIFIPQIALLFLFVGFLEQSGYMARVIFLTDRIMQFFGLNGRSIVPLVSGIACAIPGIMAARTIDNPKERLITILVTPFMTCAARLPVYVIFIAIAIPDSEVWGFNLKGITLLGLYALGTLAALFGALILSKMVKTRSSQSMLLELPSFQFPRISDILISVWNKIKTFVVEAGKVIFVISIILWFLASYGPGKYDEKINDFESGLTAQNIESAEVEDQVNAFALEQSYAGKIGKFMEPAVRPLGYDWKISIALLSSFAAREVFVGTLATIYSVNADFSEETLITKLKKEKNPFTMKPQFNLATSMSLLIFYVFAMQCMSTLAIVKRETGTWKWPILQFVVMTLIAYLAALSTYQILS